MSIILASGSPRRKELLEMLEVKDLKIIPAKGAECPPAGAGPEETVKALSMQKAQEVSACAEDSDIVIAADTVVWFADKIYGKPHSKAEAKKMLSELSGNTHQVYTGVTVVNGSRIICECEVSHVHFRDISEQEIDRYIMTGEPMDKAGSYGAQGKGALFVESIDGDFFNVMGLPLCRLDFMLKKIGFNLI